MKVFQEKLYHFSCSKCSKWWSVADLKPRVGSVVFCPHCGSKNKVEQVIVSAQLYTVKENKASE